MNINKNDNRLINDDLPEVVQDILREFEKEDNTYEVCRELDHALAILGYSIEWGLDAEPFNLIKL